MKIFNSISLPTTVAKLESFCIKAAHQGHAQASIQIEGDTIQIVINENENYNQGENHEHS